MQYDEGMQTQSDEAATITNVTLIGRLAAIRNPPSIGPRIALIRRTP